MKVFYTRNDGEASYFIVTIRKNKHGFKPVLTTPEGMSFTLYKGSKIGFMDRQACIKDTIALILQDKDNVIC